MLIERKSPVTGQTNIRDIPVSTEQYVAWSMGAMIQNVMPDLSEDDREFIMTGMTPEDWERIMGEGDPEDLDDDEEAF